jgi:hypothetical protein
LHENHQPCNLCKYLANPRFHCSLLVHLRCKMYTSGVKRLA